MLLILWGASANLKEYHSHDRVTFLLAEVKPVSNIQTPPTPCCHRVPSSCRPYHYNFHDPVLNIDRLPSFKLNHTTLGQFTRSANIS